MTVPEQRFDDGSSAAVSGPKQRPAAAAAAPNGVTASSTSAFAGRFSQEGRDRQQGTLRKLASQFMGVPGVVSFSGGFPPADLFPFESLGLTVRGPGGSQLSVTVNDPAKVATAQQYNLALRGYAPLLRWAEQHVAAVHQPPGLHEVCITNGGNHTVEMLVSLLLDRGDSLLLEEYSYPHMLECVVAPKGLTAVPLPIDEHGIIPEAMEEVLERLRAHPNGVPFPKLLYTIPTALNPTGATITPARRRQVYDLCRRFGILIIEDDPYFYLQFPDTASRSASSSSGGSDSSSCGGGCGSSSSSSSSSAPESPTAPESGAAAAGGFPSGTECIAAGPAAAAAAGPPLGHAPACSYLSLDVDGRVARVDSFAKFFAPGVRLGWATAPPDLLEKLVMCLQAHTVGPCSLSQVLVSETLQAWGEQGLQAHVQRVQQAYARRAAVMLEAAEQELRGLAEWSRPCAGMFLWVRLLGVGDASEVWDELQRHKLVVLPGRVMHARASDPSFQSPYVRISFSHAPDDQIQEGIRRLGQVLRAHSAATNGAAAPAQ